MSFMSSSHYVEKCQKECSYINKAASVDLWNEGEGKVVHVLHDRGGVRSLRHQSFRTCMLQR